MKVSVILYILFILVCISVSLADSYGRKNSNDYISSGTQDDRTYVIAYRQIGKAASFVDGPSANGSSVNIVLEVCRRCGKKCETSLVSFEDSFNGECSRALDESWFDAMFLLLTKTMLLGYSASDLPIRVIPERIVISKPGKNYTEEDLKNPLNNFTVTYTRTGDFLPCYLENGYFFNASTAVLGPSLESETAIVLQKVLNEEADIGIISPVFLNQSNTFDSVVTLRCNDVINSGLRILVRKDDESMLAWFNPCFKEFVCSGDYQVFCKDQERLFGANPLCINPEEAGCPP